MAKKEQNLKPDIVLKNYWRDNERFADLFNAVLFEGEQVIQPDELENLDTEGSSVIEHRKYAEEIIMNLHDMLNIPEKLKKYVNDYKILLVEARKNDLALHNMNNVDLFNLLEILLDNRHPARETRNKAIEYTKDHRVDKSVIITAAGAVDNKINYNLLEQKGAVDMYTVFEETRIEGRAEGRAEEIIETGYEFGLSDDDILVRLQKKLEIPLETAQQYLKKFGKQTV